MAETKLKIQALQEPKMVIMNPSMPSGSTHGGSYGQTYTIKKKIRFGTCYLFAYGAGTLQVDLMEWASGTGDTGSSRDTNTFTLVNGSNMIDLDLTVPEDLIGKTIRLKSTLTTTTGMARTDEQTAATLGTMLDVDCDLFTAGVGGDASGATAPRVYYFFMLQIHEVI